MPRGDKSSYTDKQKRQAEHIEEGYEHRGVPEREAERRAWATVNKETHGGKKSGSGRGTTEDHAPSRKGGRLGFRLLQIRDAFAFHDLELVLRQQRFAQNLAKDFEHGGHGLVLRLNGEAH